LAALAPEPLALEKQVEGLAARLAVELAARLREAMEGMAALPAKAAIAGLAALVPADELEAAARLSCWLAARMNCSLELLEGAAVLAKEPRPERIGQMPPQSPEAR